MKHPEPCKPADSDPLVDHNVYPDLDFPPAELRTPEEKADYIHRVCAQWDYGIIPERETFALLAGWSEVFDRFPLSHSARILHRS